MNNEFIKQLEKNCPMYHSELHGIDHWRRVERNGLYLCSRNNADKHVVSYFAYLHDCMRENESNDPRHGPRGAYFAIQHRDLIELDDLQFQSLVSACKSHTFGKQINDVTIGTCWDADRLDLTRISISPKQEFMHNSEAKMLCEYNIFTNSENLYKQLGL